MKMEKPTCPYSASGICYRDGCIYLPSLDCMKHAEFQRRLKIIKKRLKARKRAKRGNKR